MQSLPKNEKLKLILLGVAALILVVISLLFLDQRAANLLTEEQALNSYRVTRELTDIGETGHWFALAFLCILIPWMYLKYARSVLPALRLRLERLQLWGNTFLLALIGAGLAVHLIKFAFGRARPNQSDDHYPWNFYFFNHHWHFHSFPSGHSQTLFTVAIGFAFAFPKYRYLFYVLAGLLAMTRVLLNQHFLSDVIMGGYMGYAISLLIFYRRFPSKFLN
jgi:membrane-associated phospholipid phosphatase